MMSKERQFALHQSLYQSCINLSPQAVTTRFPQTDSLGSPHRRTTTQGHIAPTLTGTRTPESGPFHGFCTETSPRSVAGV
jgi:hypothetical protein